jgi:hypothetical protein
VAAVVGAGGEVGPGGAVGSSGGGVGVIVGTVCAAAQGTIAGDHKSRAAAASAIEIPTNTRITLIDALDMIPSPYTRSFVDDTDRQILD